MRAQNYLYMPAEKRKYANNLLIRKFPSEARKLSFILP